MPSVGFAVEYRIVRPACRNRSTAPWPAAMARAMASSMPCPDAISMPSICSLRPATASAMAWAGGKASPRITTTCPVILAALLPKSTGIAPHRRAISARVVAFGCQPRPASTSQVAIPARRASRTIRADAGTPATSRSASCPAANTINANVGMSEASLFRCDYPRTRTFMRCKLCTGPVYPAG